MKMKKLASLVLALVMCVALAVPAMAAEPQEAETLPPWVGEGETWHPVGGVTPREDFGNCPKGHTGPSGYTYQGYTTGQASGHYDGFAKVLNILSNHTGNSIVTVAADLTASFLNWLQKNENPNLTYFKYVYTRSGSTFYHIIYAEKVTSSPSYTYLSCETYYG